MKRLLLTALTALSLSVSPLLGAHAAPSRVDLSASTQSAVAGTYVPVTPARIFDSRRAGGPLAAESQRSVQVTGSGGIPSTGVSAVVANLTVTSPQRGGYLSVYPGGKDFSGTSSLNFAAGETRANLVTVPLGSDGTITIRNGGGPDTGPAQAILDVQGYYLDATAAHVPSTQFTPSFAQRLLDTRRDINGPLKPGRTTYVDLYSDYEGPVYHDFRNVKALAVNLTVVNPSRPGYLTAWDGIANQPPTSSNLNFSPGRTTPNNAVVPVAYFGDVLGDLDVLEFAVRTSSASVAHLLVDLVGVYSEEDGGLVFRPLDDPVRMVDTRSGTGGNAFGAHQTRNFTPTTDVLNPTSANLTRALVGNVTAVRPTADTYLTVFADYSQLGIPPSVSSLNPARSQTVSNHTYIPLYGGFSVYNASGTADVILDITGRFDYPPNNASSLSTSGTKHPTLGVGKVTVSHRSLS